MAAYLSACCDGGMQQRRHTALRFPSFLSYRYSAPKPAATDPYNNHIIELWKQRTRRFNLSPAVAVHAVDTFVGAALELDGRQDMSVIDAVVRRLPPHTLPLSHLPSLRPPTALAPPSRGGVPTADAQPAPRSHSPLSDGGAHSPMHGPQPTDAVG